LCASPVVLTFLLSVGFLAQALPTAAGNGLAVREYSTPAGYNSGSGYNGGSEHTPSPSYSKEASPASKEGDHDHKLDLISLLAKLHDDVVPVCKELVATVLVDKIVVLVKACVAVLVNVKLLPINLIPRLQLIVKALAAVCVKLGVDIDVCLHLLLITLNVCVDELLAIIISLCAKLDVSVLTAIKVLNPQLLIKICALVKVPAGVAL
ncbi:hypothetical protein B0J17DRAFT_645561, partial [Rhizoctonia solani]